MQTLGRPRVSVQKCNLSKRVEAKYKVQKTGARTQRAQEKRQEEGRLAATTRWTEASTQGREDEQDTGKISQGVKMGNQGSAPQSNNLKQ